MCSFIHDVLDVVGVIHKLTVDEFVDCTNTLTTCCGEIYKVHNVEIPLRGQSVIKANTSRGQPVYKM